MYYKVQYRYECDDNYYPDYVKEKDFSDTVKAGKFFDLVTEISDEVNLFRMEDRDGEYYEAECLRRYRREEDDLYDEHALEE